MCIRPCIGNCSSSCMCSTVTQDSHKAKSQCRHLAVAWTDALLAADLLSVGKNASNTMEGPYLHKPLDHKFKFQSMYQMGVLFFETQSGFDSGIGVASNRFQACSILSCSGARCHMFQTRAEFGFSLHDWCLSFLVQARLCRPVWSRLSWRSEIVPSLPAMHHPNNLLH